MISGTRAALLRLLSLESGYLAAHVGLFELCSVGLLFDPD